MHVVGEDDPGVDVKRCAGAHPANRIAQRVDIRHQQVRAPIKQVYGKEEGPAWNPIAAIIRHLGSIHGRGERRNALRCSALRLLVLGLLDQVYGLRRQLRRLCDALASQPPEVQATIKRTMEPSDGKQ